jgi:hypothetical protein
MRVLHISAFRWINNPNGIPEATAERSERNGLLNEYDDCTYRAKRMLLMQSCTRTARVLELAQFCVDFRS